MYISGTIFARWGNGPNSAVGIVGRALAGSCECGITPPAGEGPDSPWVNTACTNNCIRYARQAGNVRVINLSWGRLRPQASSPNVPDMQRQVIQEFCNSGGIITIAAMNGEQATPTSPMVGVNVIRPGARMYPAAFAEDLAGGSGTPGDQLLGCYQQA